MAVLGDEPTAITAELAALVERRRPAAAPRRSWASTEPFVAGERVRLEGAEGDTWRGAANGYVERAMAVDFVVVAATLTVLGLSDKLGSLGRGVPTILSALSFLVAVAVGHGYDVKVVGDGPREYQAVLRAGVAAVAVPAIITAIAYYKFPRFGVLAFAAAVTILSVLSRRVLRLWLHRARRQGWAMARTLVVGDAESVHSVVHQMRSSTHHGYRVVGMCLPSIADLPPQDGVPMLGSYADVVQVAYDYSIETVIVAGSGLTGDALRRLSWALGRTDAELVVAPGLVEVMSPRLTVRDSVGLSLLEVETVPPRSRLLAKGALDRVLGSALLLAVLPLIAAGALAVRLSSKGPAIFRQERVGIDGRTFTMLKLRSMHADAEKRKAALAEKNEGNGVLFKMHDDPRVTKVGRLLRRFSIDELPQLWNVAKGDMSLVGPRPPLRDEVDCYQDEVYRRLHVRPGLTGLWQVSGRSDLSWEESVRLDLRYVDNWSVAMDLQILWKTGRAVFQSAGAY